MRFFINGVEGGGYNLIKSADLAFNCLFMGDQGAVVSIVSPASAIIEVFSSPTRADTPLLTLTITPGAGAAAGYGTTNIEDNLSALTRGTLYLWGKVSSPAGTGPSSLVQIGRSPTSLVVI